MKLTLQHAEAAALGDVDMHRLSNMIYAALPDFYGALPQEHSATLDMIAAETHVPGTECHDPLIATIEGTCAGMICSFPMQELRARQQQSMLHVMRSLDRAARKEFRQRMVSGNHSAAEITLSHGLYIARIAVADEFRRTGLGSSMFGQFEKMAQGQPIALHVDRENALAIGFYKRLGFAFTDDADNSKKRAMVRQVGKKQT